MEAFGIFEGGGARGYAHVGALQAAEERGIRFVGVAGTSIGAIVAALIAAGYSGRELYRIEGGQPVGLLAFDPLTKLNPADYAAWERFRGDPFGREAPGPLAAGVRKLRARADRRAGAPARRPSAFALGVGVFLAARAHGAVLDGLWRSFGMASTAPLRRWLDDAMRAKLGMAKGPVLFRHLGARPLKVVATDLATGQAHVLGRSEHANMRVADAVIASATFPLLLRPVMIGAGFYVDGGLTSNLPAWVFDDERRRRDRATPTFGFRLVDPPLKVDAGPPGDFAAFLRKMVRACVSGAQTLETRGIDDCHVVELPTDIGTLDFSDAEHKTMTLVEAGREEVRKLFDRGVGPRDPDEMAKQLQTVATFFKGLVDAEGVPIVLPRAYVLLPGEGGLARVAYSSVPEADERMSFWITSPGPTACLDRREPILTKIEEIPDTLRRHSLYKLEHALRPPLVKIVYGVPIFRDPAEWARTDLTERAVPRGVLVFEVESDVAIAFSSRRMEDRLAGYAQLVGECLSQRLDPLEAGEHRASEEWSDLEEVHGGSGAYVSSRKGRDLKLDDDARRLRGYMVQVREGLEPSPAG